MQCKDVEAVVEQEGLAPLPEAARMHVAGCPHCQEFVSDLATIVNLANELPAEVEPPARVWVSLRTQLELEGIIKEPVLAPAPERVSGWQGFRELFRSHALATVAVGLMILVAAALQIQLPRNATPKIQESRNTPPIRVTLLAQTAFALNEQEHTVRNMRLASTSAVDNSYRQSLQQVDDFIADCERRIKEEPQDELALEYLSSAYQQKAGLLSAMMDRGGSVN
jgi:hypothetical protein